MNLKLIQDYYRKQNIDKATTEEAILQLTVFENFLASHNQSIDNCTFQIIQDYMDLLISKDTNQLTNIIPLARYFKVTGQHENYIYFTKITGGIGVISSIKERFSQHVDKTTLHKIFLTTTEPPLGTCPTKVPVFTKALMTQIQNEVTPEIYKRALAGNNHNIPIEIMLDEKKHYEKSSSLGSYLKERHTRKVEELQAYCDEKKVWFEQEITQEAVDFVKANQEILSAVKRDNYLYITKIPYRVEAFLKSDSDVERSYNACHCPFARESITDTSATIDSDWCYCSGGFAKFPFEVILDRPLEVELVSSALKGDSLCRFRIPLD